MHNTLYRLFIYALTSLFFMNSPTVLAGTPVLDSDEKQIIEILKETETPDGIVFEIIGDGGEYLTQALKKIESYQTQLKEKFPGIEIAVVSHGIEQFALKTSQHSDYEEAHNSVKQLFKSEVPVHVCETHASWLGVTPEDFPNYVDVAPTGPTQIKQYQELGYTLIQVE